MKLETIALVDLDSTLADFEKAMNTFMIQLAGPDETPALWTCSRDEMPGFIKARRALVKKLPGFWENLARIDAGFEIYELIGHLGFTRHILTKGPERSTAAWTEKVRWCQREVPEAAITITMDKGLVYGRVLVDDWPPYIMQWLAWRPRGLVVMLDWPHNQEVKDEDGNMVPFEHPNVFRYIQNLGKSGKARQMVRLGARLQEAYVR